MIRRYDPLEAVLVAGHSLFEYVASKSDKNQAERTDYVFFGALMVALVIASLSHDFYMLFLQDSALHLKFNSAWPVKEELRGNFGRAVSPDRAFHFFIATVSSFIASYVFYGGRRGARRVAAWNEAERSSLRLPVSICAFLMLASAGFAPLQIAIAMHIVLLILIVVLANRSRER